MNLLLEGIRILDFTTIVSGPTGTAILADMGAEVIKVETPKSGDPMRHYPPHYTPERSGFFVDLNRNKKSITLDLRNPECQEVLKKAYANVDVVFENFKPGTLTKLGVGYETAKKVNPSIIYAALSGFGQDGPYSDRPCFDIVAQGMSGLMSINGASDGSPTKVGVDAVDMLSGIYGATGILAALVNRQKTGEGQFIDIGMLDCAIAFLEQNVQVADALKVTPHRIGNENPTGAPYNVYPTVDGNIIVVAGPQGQFDRLCQIAGRPELIGDPKYDGMAARNKCRTEVNKLVSDWTSTVTTAEACSLLEEAGIVNGAVFTIPEMFENPQVKHRGSIADLDDKVAGPVKVRALPLKFSGADTSVRFSAPLLGEHNKDIYCDTFGFSDEAYKRLIDDAII